MKSALSGVGNKKQTEFGSGTTRSVTSGSHKMMAAGNQMTQHFLAHGLMKASPVGLKNVTVMTKVGAG